jgi:hypothetical protein
MKQNLKKDGMTTCVNVVSITKKNVVIQINNEEFFVYFERVPAFINAKVEEIFDVKMNGFDEIRWEKLDVDLDIDSLRYPENYPLIMRYCTIEEEPIIAAEQEIIYNTTP